MEKLVRQLDETSTRIGERLTFIEQRVNALEEVTEPGDRPASEVLGPKDE